jgi:hypothetical protein
MHRRCASGAGTLHYDDEFRSVLVSMGCMGVINSLIIDQ